MARKDPLRPNRKVSTATTSEEQDVRDALRGYSFQDIWSEHSEFKDADLVPWTCGHHLYHQYCEWYERGLPNLGEFLTRQEFGVALHTVLDMRDAKKNADDNGLMYKGQRKVDGEKVRGYFGIEGPTSILVTRPSFTAGRPRKS